MSGQEVTVPLSRVASLSLGSVREEDVTVGIWNTGGFLPEGSRIEGFLSLSFFERHPFTDDYHSGLIIFEDKVSIERRSANGAIVAIDILRDGPAVTVIMSLQVAGQYPALVEVDTGSDALILDTKYMSLLGLEPDGSLVRRIEGSDETGRSFTRYFFRAA